MQVKNLQPQLVNPFRDLSAAHIQIDLGQFRMQEVARERLD